TRTSRWASSSSARRINAPLPITAPGIRFTMRTGPAPAKRRQGYALRQMPSPPRGRFAPSPTGKLHLGNARSALLGWLQARSLGGEFLLRIEDLDQARCRPEHEANLLRDLEYLGLTWDGPLVRQSERGAAYEEALARLDRDGLLYPCFCSRAEIARAA